MQMELHPVHIKILKLANFNSIYRGIFGWPQFIDANDIRRLVDGGYLRLFYDWERDRVLVKITALGRSRWDEIVSANLHPLED